MASVDWRMRAAYSLRGSSSIPSPRSDAFVEQHLDDDYGRLARQLAARLARERPPSPLVRGTIVGVGVNVVTVDCGPDVRTGLTARVRRDGATRPC